MVAKRCRGTRSGVELGSHLARRSERGRPRRSGGHVRQSLYNDRDWRLGWAICRDAGGRCYIRPEPVDHGTRVTQTQGVR
jgi:hypothetical protein